MSDPEAAVEELIASRPGIHWTDEDWGLDRDSMRWLADHVQPGSRTIETGCGQSSILFALRGADHTIVAPAEHEHAAVRDWCHERGFSTDNVRSIVDFSQDALPKLAGEEFDLALVDGAHAFPLPFIDWYFMAAALKVGGHLVVDDVRLRTGRVLREFLLDDAPRWQLVADMGTTVMLRKLEDPVVPENDWLGQPWSLEPEPAASRFSSVRDRVRLRTRVRDMARRGRGVWTVFRPLPFKVALFYFRAARLAYRSEDEHAIVAHMQPDSLARLLRLCEGRRRVVELGTAEAWTAVALAIADPRRTVTSLDPFPYPTREEYLRMAPRSALDRIELVQEFGEVEPSVRDVEFLFIDASHRRELTVQTFRAWQPALAPGAIVAFHDYDNAAHPGVNAAIADLGLEGEVHGDIFAWHAG